MPQYEIAGLKLDIAANRGSLRQLKTFESDFATKPDVEIRFKLCGHFTVPEYYKRENDPISWFSKNNSEMMSMFVHLRKTNRIEYIIEAKQDWSDITILYREGIRNAEKAFCDFLGNYIISNIAILHGGFVLHASSISFFGKGIAFTAPSGTGKSTHTAMWKKYYKATILNDDCPFIKNESKRTFIYGTPWSGSKKEGTSSSSPLSAIIILEQSEQNSIHELSNKAAIPLILPRIFLPYQNAELMNAALINADKAIRDVPKYLLRCRPDQEAAKLVYQCVM
jgi:hypothetical protein